MKAVSVASCLSFIVAFSCLFPAEAGESRGTTSLEDAGERYKSAIVFHEIKYYDQSINQLKKIVQDYPDSKWADDARYMIGYFYLYDKRDFKNAVVAYQSFLEAHPKHNYAMKAQIEIGNSFYMQGNYTEAINAYRKAIEDYTTTSNLRADLTYRMGNCYRWLKDYESAVAEYKKIVVDYRDLPIAASAQYQMGNVYAASGGANKAKEAYGEVISRFSKSPLAASAKKSIELLEERRAPEGRRDSGSENR